MRVQEKYWKKHGRKYWNKKTAYLETKAAICRDSVRTDGFRMHRKKYICTHGIYGMIREMENTL